MAKRLWRGFPPAWLRRHCRDHRRPLEGPGADRRRASQLAGAAGCSIFEYDAAAEQFELRATHNDDTAFVEALRAVPLRKGEGLMGRAAEMREPIQVADITQPGTYQE